MLHYPSLVPIDWKETYDMEFEDEDGNITLKNYGEEDSVQV